MATLRPAAQHDFPAIRSLIHKANINPIGLDWRRFVVAVDELDQVIACGQIKPHRDGSLELASIAVEEAWRGHGLGSRVVLHLIDQHLPPGQPVYLTCRASLGPFYARFGFRPLEPQEMPPYFHRIYRLFGYARKTGLAREDLLVMGRSPTSRS